MSDFHNALAWDQTVITSHIRARGDNVVEPSRHAWYGGGRYCIRWKRQIRDPVPLASAFPYSSFFVR